jgi:hypothetical protein
MELSGYWLALATGRAGSQSPDLVEQREGK